MTADLVLEPRRQAIDRTLERRVLERADLAAAVADNVMMMLAAGKRRLVGGRLSKLHPAHQAHAGEQLERAVDACDAGVAAAGAQVVEDLLGGKAAVLTRDHVQHRRARAAAAMARAPELVTRVLGPFGSLPRSAAHARDDSRFCRE